MDYQDPFEGSMKPVFHQDEPKQEASEAPSSTGSDPKPRRFSTRLIALCLSCALLGGLGGSLATHFFGGGSTEIQVGDRTPIQLQTVNTDTRKAMTVPEVYANYIDSCVGITVDIVTTNSWGIPVTSAAAGSGFVITQDGYIMTNYHVIEGASSIKVTFVDDKSYSATLIGGDKDNDIAIIKIEATGLKPVVMGDSSKMYVGETVLTIGNPLGELTFSLSDGVVSALERPITVSAGKSMKMIQTNTTINSGNSGGPLFNLYGEVIGIVTAKYSTGNSIMSSTMASVEGLGFAIPITSVKDKISDIIAKGYVTGKPYLGVSIQDVRADVQAYGIPAGAEMVFVAPGLAAAKAGIQEGDIITAVGDKPIKGSTDLIEAIGDYKAGDSVQLKVFRNGGSQEISATLDEQNSANTKRFEEYTTKRQQEEQQKLPQQPQQQPNGGYNFPFF